MMILTTGPSADRREPPGGFTLLEMVLVMVIICTVLAMAAPSLRGFFASRQTADAAAQMVALAQYARAQATAQGRTYRLNMDSQAGRYWLTSQTAGAFVAPSSEFGRVFLLPEGTRAKWESPTEVAEQGWVAFYADGRTDPAEIRLTGRKGENVAVACVSPAERFHVVTAGEASP